MRLTSEQIDIVREALEVLYYRYKDDTETLGKLELINGIDDYFIRKQKIVKIAEKLCEKNNEAMKRMAEENLYLIVYWNYNANQIQTERIRAKNAFRAGREFRRQRGRKHEIYTIERL